MTIPNPQLCEQYGTEINKTSHDLMRAAAPILGIGLMAHDLKHQSELVAEAERMNEAARYFEAKKMEGTINSLGGTMPKQAALDHVGTVLAKFARVDTDKLLEKVASGVELNEMEKEAIGALLGVGRALSSGITRAGKGLSEFGSRAAKGTLTPTGRLQRAAGGEAAQFAEAVRPGLRQRAGQALQATGGGLQRAGAGLERKTMQQALKAPKVPTGQVAASRSAGPYRTAAKPQAGASVASAPAAAAEATGKAKPLLSGMTKAKLLGGAGLLGAGYVGYKGLQAVRDYMMVPSGAHQQWGYGSPLRHNITPYGY